MAKVVVSGGAGFIGSHIVEALLAEGHEVLVIDNLSTGSRSNLPEGCKLEVIDIRSKGIAALMERFSPEMMVHTAAQISVTESMKDPVFDADVNICGLINLLHAFAGRRLPYTVFLSTGGAIYGEQDYFPADEGHKIEPTSVYGTAKRASELYLALWARSHGLKYAALRLSNVYGPRQNPHGEAGVVAIFNNKLLRGEVPVIYGGGEQTRDFVFVKDVAQAVRTVCERGIEGTYNIGTGKETSVNTLYDLICAALGSKVKASYQPQRSGEQMRSCINAGLALKTFGWKPGFSLQEGLKQTCDWFRSGLS